MKVSPPTLDYENPDDSHPPIVVQVLKAIGLGLLIVLVMGIAGVIALRILFPAMF